MFLDREKRIWELNKENAQLTRENKKLLQEITDLIAAGQRAEAAVNARDTRQKAEIATLQASQVSDADKAGIAQTTAEVTNFASGIEAENAAAAPEAEASPNG